MDQDTADRLVFHLEDSEIARLHREIRGGVIQLEALRALDLHGVVGPVLQRQEHPAVSIRGHGVHQSAVHLPDFKGHIGDALGLVGGIDLDQLHAADGVVIHRNGLGVVGVDDHRLGAGLLMDGVAPSMVLVSVMMNVPTKPSMMIWPFSSVR